MITVLYMDEISCSMLTKSKSVSTDITVVNTTMDYFTFFYIFFALSVLLFNSPVTSELCELPMEDGYTIHEHDLDMVDLEKLKTKEKIIIGKKHNWTQKMF